ncbi:MAG TPA: hypothetical protein DEO82_06700 [Eubacterium sp.]|nr:hypothetical protein [Eubacterium sp.]
MNIYTDIASLQENYQDISYLTEGESLLILEDTALMTMYKGVYPIIAISLDYSKVPIHPYIYVLESAEDLVIADAVAIYNRFYGISNIIAKTDRLIIREETVADVKNLYELYDDNICRYTEPLYPLPEEEAFIRDYIVNMYNLHGFGLWLLTNYEDHIVGRAGLSLRLIDDVQCLELGYIIGTAYQHQGLATEACKAILEFASEHTEFDSIYICTESDNEASKALAIKLGFNLYDQSENMLIYKKGLTA